MKFLKTPSHFKSLLRRIANKLTEILYQDLTKHHQDLTKHHQELFRNHQNLESAYKHQEKVIFKLRNEPRYKRIVAALEVENLFSVEDIIVEAPCPPVSKGIRNALANNGYETVELYYVRNLVRPGDNVLDLGSGLGLTSISAAIALQGKGRVVGYEADPRIAKIAQKNADRNNVNVEIRNYAISSEEGFLDLYVSQEFLANSAFENTNTEKISVPCKKIQTVIDEISPQVISCDVEGVEGSLFDGVDLSCVRSMVLETHEQYLGTKGVEKCIKHLAQAGLHRVESLTWGPVMVFDRDGSANSIYPFMIDSQGSLFEGDVPNQSLLDVSDATIFSDVYKFKRNSEKPSDPVLVWYSPNWLYWWGGGILTILRFANLIARKDVKTMIYVYDNKGHPTLEKLCADLDEAYPGHQIKITTDITSIPKNHIAIATTHQSVFHVLRAPDCADRFYFMQEYESLLYPGGTFSEQANATYRLGFKGICGGDWLKNTFKSYGGEAISFNFSIDKSIFYPSKIRAKVKRLFFFGRPSTDRRMYELGFAVVKEISKLHPSLEIVVAGMDGLSFPFPVTNLGNLEISKTGDLYRTCDIGLTFSGSNMSYLPVELMASGVPVITNAGPHVEWYCKHKMNSMVCEPFVSAFIQGFEELFNSPKLRESLVKGGLETTSKTSWEQEAEKIYSYLIK